MGLIPQRVASLTSLILAASFAASLPAADWPQFLGPQRNAVADSSEPALPDTFPTELKPLWEKSVGSGFAGPVVVDGKVIIFHREGSDMTTEALDSVTGKPLWRSTYVTDYVDSFGFDNGPRAVPAVAANKIFVHGPEGRVTALDLITGKELWNYDTASAVSSQQGFFGRAPSPLVMGSHVIIAAGGVMNGKPAGLISLESDTGKLAWTSADDEAGYASPVSAGPDQSQLLAWMRNRLWLVDATTGDVRYSQYLRSRMMASVNAATPIHCGNNQWFVSAGYGVGAHLLRVNGDKGKDSATIETIWEKQDLLDCHYCTPIYRDGYIYGFHGRQETGQVLRCISVKDGKQVWNSPKVPGGTIILIGDKLLVVTEQGELWIVRASPDSFEQLASIQILRSGHRSHAAYANGILYARDTENLIAVKLR